MSDDELKMVIQVLGSGLAEDEDEVNRIVQILVTETLKFRDKLKEDVGIILTVADTQAALGALDEALEGAPLAKELTSEQKALAQIYLDRLTLFKQ